MSDLQPVNNEQGLFCVIVQAEIEFDWQCCLLAGTQSDKGWHQLAAEPLSCHSAVTFSKVRPVNTSLVRCGPHEMKADPCITCCCMPHTLVISRGACALHVTAVILMLQE